MPAKILIVQMYNEQFFINEKQLEFLQQNHAQPIDLHSIFGTHRKLTIPTLFLQNKYKLKI